MIKKVGIWAFCKAEALPYVEGNESLALMKNVGQTFRFADRAVRKGQSGR
ncbi:MAG: hypothetical protein L3J17_01350 [Candidatus Jettenia sp.]|nr:MAG: hypothetical protein L3J17_01350 [Candidatus Jettenia sp.]